MAQLPHRVPCPGWLKAWRPVGSRPAARLANLVITLSEASIQALAHIYDESIIDIDTRHPVTGPYREVAELRFARPVMRAP